MAIIITNPFAVALRLLLLHCNPQRTTGTTKTNYIRFCPSVVLVCNSKLLSPRSNAIDYTVAINNQQIG